MEADDSLWRPLKGKPKGEEEEAYVRMECHDRRRVLASLRCGCLPLQIEVGRIRQPIKCRWRTGSASCATLERLRIPPIVLIICPIFHDLWCKLFNEFPNYPSLTDYPTKTYIHNVIS